MTVDDVRRSILEMDITEATNLIMKIRASRRISKKQVEAKPKKVAATKKATAATKAPDLDPSKLSPEQAKKLLELLLKGGMKA